VSLFCDTGLRVSELVGIDVNDIDFVRNRVSVHRKGGYTDITYFSDVTAALLTSYLTDRGKFVDKMENSLFVSFVGKNKGHRLSVRSVEIMIKKYAVAAGVANADKMSPHKLRHTCAMSLLKATGNIALVKSKLSHKSITATTVYAETDDTDLENVRNIRHEQHDEN
jgi:site-specific recombinase XerD